MDLDIILQSLDGKREESLLAFSFPILDGSNQLTLAGCLSYKEIETISVPKALSNNCHSYFQRHI